MRKLIIGFLLLGTALLFGQTDLGEFLIEGKAKALQDTINLKEDLTEFNTLSEMDKFEYKAYLDKEYKQPLAEGRQFDNAFTAVVGNRYLASFGAILHYSKLLRFSGDFSHYSIKKDWSDLRGKLSWEPGFNGIHLRVSTAGGYIDPDSLSSKYLGFKTTLDYDKRYSLGNVDFINSGFKFGFNQFDIDDDISNYWDFTGGTNWQWEDVYGDIRLSNYNPVFMSEFSFKTTTIPNLEEGGIWLGIYDKDLYLSIPFRFQTSIPYDVTLKSGNTPELGNSSLLQKVMGQPYRDFSFGLHQNLRTVNFDLSLQHNNFIPLELTYNFSVYQSYELLIAGTNNYVAPFYGRVIQNSLDLELAKEWNGFRYEQDIAVISSKIIDSDGVFSYEVIEDFVPYLERFRASSSLEYSFREWWIKPELNFLIGRKDETEQAMDELILLNLNGGYKLSEKMSLNLKLNNLLNQKHKQYSNIPSKSMEGSLGVIWEF